MPASSNEVVAEFPSLPRNVVLLDLVIVLSQQDHGSILLLAVESAQTARGFRLAMGVSLRIVVWTIGETLCAFVPVDLVVLIGLSRLLTSSSRILTVVAIESVLVGHQRLSLPADSLLVVSARVFPLLVHSAFLVFGLLVLVMQFLVFGDVIVAFLVNGCILSLNQLRRAVLLPQLLAVEIHPGVVLDEPDVVEHWNLTVLWVIGSIWKYVVQVVVVLLIWTRRWSFTEVVAFLENFEGGFVELRIVAIAGLHIHYHKLAFLKQLLDL